MGESVPGLTYDEAPGRAAGTARGVSPFQAWGWLNLTAIRKSNE